MGSSRKGKKRKQRLLTILYQSQHGACGYCSRQVILGEDAHNSKLGATIDHKHSLSKGGADASENMIMACSECNFHKGNAALHIWEMAMEKFPRWWERPGGGHRLRNYLRDVVYLKKQLEWPWHRDLMKWTIENSTYDAKLFFCREYAN